MKTIYYKKLHLFLLCFMLWGGASFFNKAVASHMVGSDLTYTCTGTAGVWHVTLTFYRDCTGIPVCNGGCGGSCTRTVSLVGADGSCSGTSFASSISLSLTSVSDVNINPLCPNAKSICDNTGCVSPGD